MQFRYETPEALWGLLAVLVILGVMFWQRRRFPATFSWRRAVVMLVAFTSCVLALARPQMGHYAAAQRSRNGNVFFAIDISKSMLAEDTTPSRLGFSVAFTRKLLEALPGARVAVFPFAADGFLQLPLSTDTQAASDIIGSLSPNMVTNQGTDFTTSLETLLDLILKMEGRVREAGGDWAPTQVVLFSDGETHRPVREAILGKFRAQRIPIFTVAVGTTEGAFIPVDARFGVGRENLRDREGRTVRTRMEPASLQKIAQATGGDFYPSRFEEVFRVATRVNQAMQIGKLTATFKADKELFPYFLLVAIVLFALELSAGNWEYALRALIFGALLLAPRPAAAMSDETQAQLDKAGQRRDVEAYNLGVQRLQQGNLNEAAELFTESASATKSPDLKKRALYDLGNTLVRLQDPVQALAVYQNALDTKARDKKLEADANRRISDNIVLATKQEEKRREEQQKKQGQSGEEQQKKDGGQDPKGPQQFRAQEFDEKQKQRMFDLVSDEEQQVLQRLQGKKAKNPQSAVEGKEW